MSFGFSVYQGKTLMYRDKSYFGDLKYEGDVGSMKGLVYFQWEQLEHV